jgi:DNA-binding response OmpR family regulator
MERPSKCRMADSGSVSAKKVPRIILLEDEMPLSKLFEFLIREWFTKVALLKFKSSEKAWLELSHHAPDLLIMDWGQPGINGRQMLDKLADVHANFPILLTADTFGEHLKILVKHGLKLGYLPKPFGIQEFWDALNQLVGPSDVPERKKRAETVFDYRH